MIVWTSTGCFFPTGFTQKGSKYGTGSAQSWNQWNKTPCSYSIRCLTDMIGAYQLVGKWRSSIIDRDAKSGLKILPVMSHCLPVSYSFVFLSEKGIIQSSLTSYLSVCITIQKLQKKEKVVWHQRAPQHSWQINNGFKKWPTHSHRMLWTARVWR